MKKVRLAKRCAVRMRVTPAVRMKAQNEGYLSFALV
jgi:hypothetical protein